MVKNDVKVVVPHDAQKYITTNTYTITLNNNQTDKEKQQSKGDHKRNTNSNMVVGHTSNFDKVTIFKPKIPHSYFAFAINK